MAGSVNSDSLRNSSNVSNLPIPRPVNHVVPNDRMSSTSSRKSSSLSFSRIIELQPSDENTKKNKTKKKVKVKHVQNKIIVGICVLGLSGTVFASLVIFDTGADIILHWLPPKILLSMKEFKVIKPLRILSFGLINLATCLAICMLLRVRKGDMRAKALRWCVLVTTIMAVLVSFPFTSISFIVTALLGASLVAHYTGLIPNETGEIILSDLFTQPEQTHQEHSASEYGIQLASLSTKRLGTDTSKVSTGTTGADFTPPT